MGVRKARRGIGGWNDRGVGIHGRAGVGLFVGATVGVVAFALCAAAGWADAHLEVEDGGKVESVEQGGLGDAGVGGGVPGGADGVVEGVERGF